MFTSWKRMLDYYLHFTNFEDIFANMLCCINICFAWDLLLKSKKENHILLLNIIFYGKTVFTSATCNWWTSVRYNGPCSCVLCYHTQKRNNHLYWKISFSCIFAKKSNSHSHFEYMKHIKSYPGIFVFVSSPKCFFIISVHLPLC